MHYAMRLTYTAESETTPGLQVTNTTAAFV